MSVSGQGITSAFFFHECVIEAMPVLLKHLKQVETPMMVRDIEPVVCLAANSHFTARTVFNALMELQVPFTMKSKFYDRTTVTESPHNLNDGYWTMESFRFLPNGKRNYVDPDEGNLYFSPHDIAQTKAAAMRELVKPVLGKLNVWPG